MAFTKESMESYHANKAIGSSTAKLYLESPQLYKDEIDGVVEHTGSKAFQFGTAFHAMILEPELFVANASQGPINDKTGKPYGAETKAFLEWEAANPGKIIVSEQDGEVMQRMRDRMPSEVATIFASKTAQTEVSVYGAHADLSLKCRPDHLDGTMITDLKTVGNIDSIGHAFKSYKYWFSQEWYKSILKGVTGQVHRFQFVFAEKEPPYRWRIVSTSQEVNEEGAMLVRGVLIGLVEGYATGNWADIGSVREEVTWPDCGYWEDQS